MEAIHYIGIGYIIVSFTTLYIVVRRAKKIVVRRAKKYAAKCGHKWYDLGDAKKWEYYLKSIGTWRDN